jgi:rhodanese-related sulfurtransferase
MNKGLTALSIEAFKKEIEDDAIILDTRNATEFTQGFIPNAISIGLEGRFAEWAGVLLPFHHKLVLVTDIGKEEETITRLTRVGFDQIIGYLAGSYQAWVDAGEKIDLIIDVEPDELKMDMNYDTRLVILDVRKELEFESGHVQTAVNIPLQTMNDVAVLSNIEDNDNVYIHCAGGYRSVIAASIMKKQGFHNIRNVLGGYDQIKLVPEMPLVAAKEVLN